MITVPGTLRESAAASFGDAGLRWCASLPATAAEYFNRWDLTLDLPDGAEPWHGMCGIVVPVRLRSGHPAVVKISWPHEENAHEHTALAAWAGTAAVRLLAADGPRRVLLLERLDAARDLRSLPVDEAIGVLTDLLCRLAVPAPAQIETLADLTARWVDDLPRRWRRLATPPCSKRLLDQAVDIARQLGPDSLTHGGRLLIHTDLHYENVLATLPGERAARGDWLAIDPKPLAGDPAFGVLPMVWNRLDELDDGDPGAALWRRMRLAAGSAGLDVERVRAWSVARAVETVIWNAEVGMVQDELRPAWVAETLGRADAP